MLSKLSTQKPSFLSFLTQQVIHPFGKDTLGLLIHVLHLFHIRTWQVLWPVQIETWSFCLKAESYVGIPANLNKYVSYLIHAHIRTTSINKVFLHIENPIFSHKIVTFPQEKGDWAVHLLCIVPIVTLIFFSLSAFHSHFSHSVTTCQFLTQEKSVPLTCSKEIRHFCTKPCEILFTMLVLYLAL